MDERKRTQVGNGQKAVDMYLRVQMDALLNVGTRNIIVNRGSRVREQ